MVKCCVCGKSMKLDSYGKKEDGNVNIIWRCILPCDGIRCLKQKDNYRRKRYRLDPEYRERCLAYKRKKSKCSLRKI